MLININQLISEGDCKTQTRFLLFYHSDGTTSHSLLSLLWYLLNEIKLKKRFASIFATVHVVYAYNFKGKLVKCEVTGSRKWVKGLFMHTISKVSLLNVKLLTLGNG